MAQVLKLKRTSVQGKVPSTSNLELGELAINTYDGKLFFQKDDGILSIQSILVTDTLITGSLNLNGDITASNLLLNGSSTIDGDIYLGGNIYIGDSIADTISVSAQFSGSLTPDGDEYYDLGSSVKKWNNLWVKNVQATNVYGSINATNGIVSGSSQLTSSFDSRYLNVLGEGNISGSFSGSFSGDGSGLTNLPAADVSQVATVTSSFDNTSSISVSHNFNTKNVIISVYQSNDTQIIPQSVTLTNNNTVDIILSGNHSGYVVVAKGGHIVSGSADDSNKLNGQPGSYYLDYTNFTNTPITTYKEDVSGNSTYTITHNLNEEYPIVQSWNTSTNRQEVPSIVESLSLNSIEVTFSGNFSGRIIVKK